MNSGVILHVMHDEKFNDMAIRQFEDVAPGVNEYWVTSAKLVFTKSPLAQRCRQQDLRAQVRRNDVVGIVFHSLPPTRYRLLKLIPRNKRVAWLGWGYDYYFLIHRNGGDSLILPKTASILKVAVIKRVKEILWQRLSEVRHPSKIFPRILRRVDYFSPVLDVEFNMVKAAVGLHAEYTEWNYGTAEEDFAPWIDLNSTGRNILAGNSASATNNHIELFEAIQDQADLADRKVIVPLSYGDLWYRDKVLAAGSRILGNAFVPLIEFLPKTEYLKMVSSCGFVVMNHLRQQAVGNVCAGMLTGASIYLNKASPLLRWLRSRGATIGDVGHIGMTRLSTDEQQRNRNVVYGHWGQTAQARKTLALVNKLLSPQ